MANRPRGYGLTAEIASKVIKMINLNINSNQKDLSII